MSTKSSADNRRFPRIDHVSSKDIIHLDLKQTPQKNHILTKNVSASGICFTSQQKLLPSSCFLIHIHENNYPQSKTQNWISSGEFYLARIVWIKKIDDPNQDLYEVGATFIEKDKCNEELLQTFTELVNIKMLEDLQGHAQPELTGTSLRTSY